MTRPSVLNLFWLNVAASGVGKSETLKLEDFEVSKFTRAGK